MFNSVENKETKEIVKFNKKKKEKILSQLILYADINKFIGGGTSNTIQTKQYKQRVWDALENLVKDNYANDYLTMPDGN